MTDISADVASTYRSKPTFDTFCKLMKSVSNFMFGGIWFHIFGPKDFKLFVYNVHSSFKALHHDVI